MTQPYRIEPDLDFVRDVIRSGGETVKKCFQCATCSVVCPISPEQEPFPRKEMIQAQWGLKDKLVRDPDIWLCHNCNDCSTNCPRGARPGDVLNALRQKSIEHYSVPGKLARMVSDRKYLPHLLGIPTLLFLIVILFTHRFGESILMSHGQQISLEGLIRSWKMIPMLAVDVIFILTSVLVVGVFANGVARFWKDMDALRPRRSGMVPSAIEVIQELLFHRNFKECGTSQDRYLGHLGVFYGFVALFVVTTCIFIGIYFLSLVADIPPTPWAWWNPVKLLANLGAIALLAGCFLLIRSRLAGEEDAKSSYYDWFFLGLVTAVGLTGLAAEVVRWIGIDFLYYVLYFMHLVFVWSMIAYLPYSKFAHLVYRTAALIHAKASGRDLKGRPPVRVLSPRGADSPV
ncbi:MAG: quinone-interacting membrane-bound oxidoreductase complex subunit QmoC [bacterium]